MNAAFVPSDLERELLYAYTQGMTHRQMASALPLTRAGVGTAAARMHQRMGAKDQAQAVHIAYQLGILTVGGVA